MTIEPVALSRDVPAARVIQAQLGELDLAIWRSESGVISAWENRCPHRGMRLSHGFVRGERLACLYHGWHYSTAGFCEIIPAHPELNPPKTFCTVQYQVVESAGVIWVSDDRLDTLTTKPVQRPAPPSLPSGLQPVRSISFNASTEAVLQAFKNNPPENLIASDATDAIASNNRLHFGSDTDEDRAVLLLQNPVNTLSNNVIAHVLGGEQCNTDDLINLSRWCESVRRFAEQPAGAEAK